MIMDDFFVSYNKADKDWATELANWLDQSMFTTILQAQDFVPSTNFVAEMHKGLQRARRMIMVLSPDYLSAKFPLAEWTAAFATDPACEKGTLIPVRVRACNPDGLLRPIVYIDLVELGVKEARKIFLQGIADVVTRKGTQEPVLNAADDEKHRRAKFKQNVKGHHNTSIQASQITNLTIKTPSKKPISIQPLDVIGAESEMRSYIEHLIGRYIELRKLGIEKGKDRRPFHPSMILESGTFSYRRRASSGHFSNGSLASLRAESIH